MPSYKYISLKVCRLSLPMIGTSLINMLCSIIGVYFVAKLGQSYLAASGLIGATYLPFLVVMTGTMFAVSILVAGCDSGKLSDLGDICRAAFFAGGLLACVVAILFYFSSDIFILFGQPLHLTLLTRSYFHWIILSLPFMLPFMICQQFFIGTERAYVNFRVTCFTLLSTAVFSYMLILGRWGAPRLGLTGWALSQSLSLALSCLLYVYYLYRLGELECFHILKWPFCIDFLIVRKIFTIGLPIGVQYAVELLAFALATYFMGWLGAPVLAAAQIVSQLTLLAVMIFLALSQASSVLVSQSSKNPLLALAYHHMSNFFGAASMVIVTICFFVVPNFFIQFYIDVNNPNNAFVVSQTKSLLILSGFMLIADAVRNITSGSLRGLHDSTTPMYWGMLCQWLLALPIGYYLGFSLHFGAEGIRSGFIIGFAVCAIGLWQRFSQKIKRVNEKNALA